MKHAVKTFFFFLICFLLVLSVSATPIPAGTYTLSGVAAGSSALRGSTTLNSDGLATAAKMTYANATFSSPTFSTVASTTSGSNPVADVAYISGSNGQVTLYYFNTADPFGGIMLCESGSGCSVASSRQIYSPEYQVNLTGGSLASVSAPSNAAPELSTWILLMTGIAMIAAVSCLRRRSGLRAEGRSL